MIASGKVLTAAHCLSNTKSGHVGETPTSVQVYFGRNGNYRFQSLTCYASSYDVNPEWDENRNEDYDFAVINVSTSISAKTGYFGYTTTLDENAKYTLAGYPYDQKKYFGSYLYADDGYTETVWSDSFTHDMNCCGGISGGPIYNGAFRVVGIHTWGSTTQGGTATKMTMNVVNLITQS